MTTRLILIRHGRSHHQDAGIAGGPRGDTGLTDRGRDQVERVAARLTQWPDLSGTPVYSSTLPRASETGRIIADALGSNAPIEHCGLCSYHVSDRFDGRPHAEGWAAARRGGGVALWRAEHEGDDTWGQLVLRAGEALHEIADEHHGRTVVIATHNETIQASLVVLGYLPFRDRLGVSLAHASVTEWATDADTTAGGPADRWTFADWNLVRLNDTGHLEG
ncbi:MAG TPA: histidine phosphatase family protein [Acidimicrobiales bacterium]|nr:histidine phosphatase family protein [Acidimicrobiales bacterium]